MRSNAAQIRPIVDLLSPVRWAIFARVQCVAFAGVDSNVATTYEGPAVPDVELRRLSRPEVPGRR